VAIELAEVMSAFPLAASFALAGGVTVLREGRRRTSLNAAMHELRRPLQVLALSLSKDAGAIGEVNSSLRLVAAAVDRLEREINGKDILGESSSIVLGAVVAAAVERWQVCARGADRGLSLRWKAGDPILHGDGEELEQALDNMISNGFEHGAGEVTVEVREVDGFVRVTVLDRGRCSLAAGRRQSSPLLRISGRDRHGHGLKIVRRAARRHGGSFQLRRSSRGTEACLELPLGGGGR
jgi:signal transduction histidine kinase